MPRYKTIRNLTALALGTVVSFSAGLAVASCAPLFTQASVEITPDSEEAQQMLNRFVPEGQRACLFRDQNRLAIAPCESDVIFGFTFSQLGL